MTIFSRVFRIYLNYFIISKRNEIYKRGTGSTFPNISSQKINEIIFPLCSLEEQIQIVQEIEKRFSACDKLESDLKEALTKADALRQSILKKAFEGRLLNQEELEATRKEADWESAEKLLEKIKMEKEKI